MSGPQTDPVMVAKANWQRQAHEVLTGRTIRRVRYMAAAEVEEMGWNSAALVIELDNGVMLFPSRDDEGNEAGAMFTTADSLPTIPVI